MNLLILHLNVQMLQLLQILHLPLLSLIPHLRTLLVSDDAGLKELYTTGMYKSLKGHQILCDVLKKQILNRNPRKEGIAFERKLNVDGTYWKPEQYPKTSSVVAKGPPVDPSTLSGFTCESSCSSDESIDSNYKLFKN